MTDTLSRRSFVARAAGLTAVGIIPTDFAIARFNDFDTAMVIGDERDRIRSAMREARIDAAAVCLVHKGAPSWIQGFGHATKAERSEVGADTLFSIQSTTKHFTTVSVLLAVQSGLLNLDEPIVSYLPEFKVRSRFERSPQERISLRLLLANRAGFTHEAPVGNNYEAAAPSFEAHVRSIADTWLRFPVGDRYRYSNLGFDLAGYILERVSGMSYADWLKTRVFNPLGMQDSTADPSVYVAAENRAIGRQDGYVELPLETPLIAAGGVWTSARDMASYLSFVLSRGAFRGQQLLSHEQWNEMHGFSFGGDYGLGVMRTERLYGTMPVRLLHHRGGGFGFGCVFTYCPEAELGFAAMFNRATSAGYGFGAKLIDQILAERLGPRVPRVPSSAVATIRPNRDQARAFAGNWLGRSVRAEVRVGEDGCLRMHRNDIDKEVRVGLTGADEMYTINDDGEVVTYRYHAATVELPAHLECSIGEESVDKNDGPDMPIGPDSRHWRPWLGSYVVDLWGKPSMEVEIEQRSGWLHINGRRLVVEVEPGLLFTSDGEAVDFRGSEPTWRNLLLRRVQA